MDILDFAKILNATGEPGGLDKGDLHREIEKRAAAARLPHQSAQQAYVAVLETPAGKELYKAMRAAPAPKSPPQDFVPRNTKPLPGPASEELSALARRLAKERRISYAQAYTRLITDPDNAELAARVRAEERQATAAVRDAREPIWQAERENERGWRLGYSRGSARN
jgi:hypothetical protein